MNYYYLAASLPSLSLDTPPPLSSLQLGALFAMHLNAADLKGLRELDGETTEPATHAFVNEWRQFECALRNALAAARAARRRIDPQPFVRGKPEFENDIERAISEAYGKENALERERALDRFRWKRIEALAGLNPFASRAVLAYALRLRLCERWSGLKEADGRAKAATLIRKAPEKDGTAVALSGIREGVL